MSDSNKRPDIRLDHLPTFRKDVHIPHDDFQQGYTESRHGTIRFTGRDFVPNFSLHDIELYIRWGYDPRDRAKSWVNKARVRIKLSQFGWNKLETDEDEYDQKLRVHNGHIIEFQRNHTIVVPAVPMVEIIEKLHMESRWPCVIQGVFDTRTEWHRIELKWR